MLNKIGGGFYTKWSRSRKMANHFFRTKINGLLDESSKSFSSLDFASKYDKQTSDRILDVLNKSSADELARYDVTRSRTLKMEEYRKNNGPFGSIEDVLRVDDYGVKVLEKLVVSIAKASTKESPKTKFKITPKVLNSVVTPVLFDEQRRKIDTVTSVCVGMKQIGWAKLESNGRLLSWDSHDFEWPEKADSMQMLNLALTIRGKLPTSDVYVTENMSINQQKPATLSDLQCYQLTTMIVTLLATQFHPPSDEKVTTWMSRNNCFFLRRKVTAQLFGLIVGNETVSAHTTINQIVDNTISKSLEHISPLSIDPLQMNAYGRSNPLKKEALSQALLMSAAFIDLAVKRNPLSFQAVFRRS